MIAMNRKRTLILIIILFTGLFPLIPIPIAKASSITVSISNSFDDVWMTESGNIFYNTFMVVILDDEIGIHSFLRFQNLAISKSAKINYATLKVYVAETEETPDPGSSVTIYGIDEPDCAPFTSDGTLWSLSRPYTSAYVNWNTTVWAGYQSVNVTDIVKEIINQYAWSSGNDLGLQILGASDSGQSPRSFEDYYHVYHEGQAQLTIIYDVAPGTPEGLPDNAVFEETYGEWDIWSVPGTTEGGPLEYIFLEGTSDPYDIMYDTIHDAPGTPVSISQTSRDSETEHGSQRKLVRTSNDTLYTIYERMPAAVYQIYSKKSIDEGATWTDEKLIGTYEGMDTNHQLDGSIAIDSEDNLHVVWAGIATGYPEWQIWYSNFTGSSWSTPILVSWHENVDDQQQGKPSMAIDSNDYLHVVWSGKDGFATQPQIIYSNFTGSSWSLYLLLSETNTLPNDVPYISPDSSDYLHIVWQGREGAETKTRIQYVNYTTSWTSPLAISDFSQYVQVSPCLAIDSSDYLHVVFQGIIDGTGRAYIRYTNYNNSVWSTNITISTAIGMDSYQQVEPSIGAGSDDDLHVLWYGRATGLQDQDKVWYAKHDDSWATPICLQQTGKNILPNLRWSKYPMVEPEYENFYLVDENNTLIETWNGDNFTDIDDLKDWIDDYVDPGGGDPLDPDPGTQGWETEGPFTRFKMRLYILIIGVACIFGPLWAMAYKRLDITQYAGCFILIVTGVGLLWSITGI